MPIIRRGEVADLPQINAIQAASAEAARWPVADYLNHNLLVALCENHVVGFLAARMVAPDECEILTLAVAPEFRRQGVGRAIIAALTGNSPMTVFLEVRESNRVARTFYNSIGFQEVSVRERYYQSPLESAIVMKFHSC
jgi:[ribosomal protein S18]-alanine N-acetyltransferase